MRGAGCKEHPEHDLNLGVAPFVLFRVHPPDHAKAYEDRQARTADDGAHARLARTRRAAVLLREDDHAGPENSRTRIRPACPVNWSRFTISSAAGRTPSPPQSPAG